MKRILLVVLALMASGCAEPTPRNLDDLSMQGPQYLDPETLEPYSGPAYRMSEDDSTQIVLRVNLRDGRFHGDFEDFDPERFRELGLGIYQTGSYMDGQRVGSYEYVYPSGAPRGHGTYENGEVNGTYESYYENGQLLGMNTYKEGVLDGPSESYHQDGRLQSRGAWNMGEACGRWIIVGEARTLPPCPPGLEDGN